MIWGKCVKGNTNVKNLRVYVVHNVLKNETTAIVPRAMRNKLVSILAVWPGTVFNNVKTRSRSRLSSVSLDLYLPFLKLY